MKNEKITFIPGWMDIGERHGYVNSLNLWSEKVNLVNKIKTEYVVGHSMGALGALINWKYNENTKLILVGPLIMKRNILSWLILWVKFMFKEKTPMPKERLILMIHIFSGIKKLIELLKINYFEIIDTIPREDLIVIRGELDNYFCGKETVDELRKRNIRVFDIKGVGHNWNKKIDEKISEIIDN